MRWLLWWRPPCLYREVLVNLVSDDDAALRGVLWGSRGAWLTLRNAAVVKGNEEITVDGEVVIHRANVAFIQVMPSPARDGRS
jgi:hypothetical protein